MEMREELKKAIVNLKEAKAKLQAAKESKIIWGYIREYELGQLDVAIYIVSELISKLESDVWV